MRCGHVRTIEAGETAIGSRGATPAYYSVPPRLAWALGRFRGEDSSATVECVNVLPGTGRRHDPLNHGAYIHSTFVPPALFYRRPRWRRRTLMGR
jgi:hypothetical protein